MGGSAEIGRAVMLGGVALVVLGAVLAGADRVPFLGRLPGDIVVRRERFTLYLPLASSVLASVALSLLVRLWRR